MQQTEEERNTKEPEATTRSTSGNHHPKKPLPKKRRSIRTTKRAGSRVHLWGKASQSRAKMTPTFCY